MDEKALAVWGSYSFSNNIEVLLNKAAFIGLYVSGELHRAIFAFIGDARLKERRLLADLVIQQSGGTSHVFQQCSELPSRVTTLPKRIHIVTYYTVSHAIDSLPFTLASTGTAALPRGAKIKFDWLIE